VGKEESFLLGRKEKWGYRDPEDAPDTKLLLGGRGQESGDGSGEKNGIEKRM